MGNIEYVCYYPKREEDKFDEEGIWGDFFCGICLFSASLAYGAPWGVVANYSDRTDPDH